MKLFQKYNCIIKIMPVDKFGRTDANSSTRVVSGGITLSQANNVFLRRDGGNAAASDINLDSHKLINVTDPVNNQDAVTKKYMLDRVSLPFKKFLAPYATDLNTYIWKDYQHIPAGLSASDFDDLPAGLYACFTAYLPASRLGNLPNNTKGYLISLTYQQPADRNKYYKWIDSTNGEEWGAYFRQGNWNTWVKSSKVSKSGDTMTGDLAFTTVATDTTRNLGCQTITTGQTFNVWLGTSNVRLAYTDFLKYLQLVIDGGFQIANANGTLFNIGINPNPLNAATFYVPIEMGGRSIVGVKDPENPQDASTKNYTDNADASKVAKAGDTMTGNLTLNVGADLLRTLGCSDLSGNKGFAVLLGSIMNQIQCQLNAPITLQTTDGFLCRSAGNDVIRFGISSTDNRTGVYRDIVMNQNFIADLHDPNTNKDAANKIYVDALSYMSAYPTMTNNTTTIDGLTYITSASSIVAGTYQPWQSFKNVVVTDGWVAATNANQWIQMQYPFPMSMSGFNIIARNIAGRNITSWKVQASNDGVAFTDIVPTNTTVFNAGILNKFVFAPSTKYMYWRYFIITSVGSVDVGISMLQWIPTLTDRYLKKCHVGYVPRLTSNTNYRGFAPSASSEFSSSYIAANAFKGDYVSGGGSTGEWATAGVFSNFWLKIACPTAVRTWKFGFRGRDGNTERIYNWRIEGSTDNTNWVTLYTAPNPTYLGNVYQEFLVDSIGKFQYYRLFCVNAEATNPGLSTMQLFVYDE